MKIHRHPTTICKHPEVVEAIAWHNTPEGQDYDRPYLRNKRYFVKVMLLIILTIFFVGIAVAMSETTIIRCAMPPPAVQPVNQFSF
jgi:hypothetical protein